MKRKTLSVAAVVLVGLCLASEALAIPAAPTPIAPIGAISTKTPTFQWTASAGAYDYLLQVRDSSNTLIQQGSGLAASICSGGTCSLAWGTYAVGSYHWSVKARDASRAGNWSPDKSFTVQPPPTPVTGAPSGYTINPNPTYTWTAAAAATTYTIQTLNADSSQKYFLDYAASTVCTGSSCAVTPGTALPIGEYTWHMRAVNAAGGSAWSALKPFSVNGTPAPVAIGPSGAVLTATPTYSWQPVTGATGYQLQALNPDSSQKFIETSIPASVCASGTCSFTSGYALALGSYSWRVRGTHAGGGGAWCALVGISVQAPPAPVPATPNGPIVGPLATYTWTPVAGATSYGLMVVDSSGGIKVLEAHASASICSGGSCAVTNPTVLAVGNYTWQARSTNAAGTSLWSAAKPFTVSGPAAPVVIAPTGTVTVAAPTYSWQPSAGATAYQLQVLNPDESQKFIETSIPASVCASGPCSFTSGYTLALGSYSWRVRGTHAGGGGAWCALVGISVQAPPAPVPATPNGPIVGPLATYTWTPVAGATSYGLMVVDSSGGIKVLEAHASASICSASSCAVTNPTVLAVGDYTWQARSTNAAGTSLWSAAKPFSVSGPAAPVVIAPTGTVTVAAPTYSWQPSAGATAYQLQVLNPDGSQKFIETSIPASVCASGTCLITSGYTLVMGTYTWRVRGTHAGGGGAWCQPVWISVEGPPAPTGTAPTGRFVDPTPTFAWTTSNSASAYNLLVLDENHVMKYVSTYGAADVCSDASCTVTPDTVLPIGQYYWQVRGVNTVGGGNWSAEWGFYADGTAAPVALAPSGVVRIARPTYSWQPAAAATGYQLEVLREDGTAAFGEWSIPDTVCSGGTCAFTSQNGLVVGNYTWHVRGTHAGGGGTWSAPIAISVLGPPAPVMISPRGNIANHTPSFAWNASAGAIGYWFQVDSVGDPSAVTSAFKANFSDAAAICSGGICKVTPNKVFVADDYQWWLVAKSEAGGTSSERVGFTVLGNTPPVPPMQPGSVVGGCQNSIVWDPTYQPDAGACLSHCSQKSANACEWNENGNCYVEFGVGCHVQAGPAGWWAAAPLPPQALPPSGCTVVLVPTPPDPRQGSEVKVTEIRTGSCPPGMVLVRIDVGKVGGESQSLPGLGWKVPECQEPGTYYFSAVYQWSVNQYPGSSYGFVVHPGPAPCIYGMSVTGVHPGQQATISWPGQQTIRSELTVYGTPSSVVQTKPENPSSTTYSHAWDVPADLPLGSILQFKVKTWNTDAASKEQLSPQVTVAEPPPPFSLTRPVFDPSDEVYRNEQLTIRWEAEGQARRKLEFCRDISWWPDSCSTLHDGSSEEQEYAFTIASNQHTGYYYAKLRIYNNAGDTIRKESDRDHDLHVRSGSPSAALVSTSALDEMAINETRRVSVTFENTGTTTWATDDFYHLRESSGNWGVATVPMPHDVEPGESVTFEVDVTAPSALGSYPMRWVMGQKDVEVSADSSPAVAIVVSDTQSAPLAGIRVERAPEVPPLFLTADVAEMVSASEQPVGFDGSQSNDPDGSISRYEWTFGDGTSAEGAVVEHQYAVKGFYTVQLTVTDDSGLQGRTVMGVSVER